MARIIVDMDNVLADIAPQYVVFYKKVKNVDIDEQELREKQAAGTVKDYHTLHSFLEMPGFFRTLPVMKDAQEILKQINDKHEVYIVSSAMRFPLSLNEKLDWLHEYFPFIQYRQIVFCGSKKMVYGDYMIDDKPKNLDPFNGKKLLFTSPSNMRIDDTPYIRVNTWQDVAKILL